MSTALRGEPTVAEFMAELQRIWEHAGDDVTFAAVVASALSVLGYTPQQWGDALFMRRISDSDFLNGLRKWERYFEQYG